MAASTTSLGTLANAAKVPDIREAGVVTGCTQGASAGTSTYWLASPATTAGNEVVDFKITTAASTAAQGTFQARVLYTSA